VVDFSLELFPPKSQGAYFSLQSALDELVALSPSFITITCGAGGSDNSHTKELVLDCAARYQPLPVKAHMTCVGRTKEELDRLADSYWDAGVTGIVALRGDAPKGETYRPHPEGYAYAIDLVAGLKQRHDFDITVAAYAEGHPEAPSLDFDLSYLKKKFDAGADQAITQFFFDPELFLRFRDRAVKRGIRKPIIPGLLPILDYPRMCHFAARCGAPIPNFLRSMFEGVAPKSLDHQLLAMNVLSHQITRLIEEGVEFFHFYSLNETLLTKHVCKWLRAGWA
jgi:methylenetetrahydrofolate reductase (NADPH)